MRGYAYAMLAVIDNLDTVRFNYRTDDQKQCALEVTAGEATGFAGKDIKEVGKNLNLVEEMMEKAGLTEEHYFVDDMNRSQAAENTIVLNLINLTEEELGSIAIDCYTGTGKDRKLVSTASGMNANETKIKRGENFKYVLAPEDFGLQQFAEEDVLSVELAVTDEIASNDVKYLYFQVDTPVNLTPETVENVTLMGDFVKGIYIQK